MVERPASVVKELLENALDAQSSQIHIDIEQGGSHLIRIIDNGDGIDQDDLSLAVTRHATSKINSLKQLESILSLGFRGEALASISAVSRLSISSKPETQEHAYKIDTSTDNDFANYQAQAEIVSHPKGTTIEVRDLFFNTPARRKFMRTVKTEFKQIDDIVKRIALSCFDVAFKLSHNKKIVRNLASASSEKQISQRISQLFSEDFLKHSHTVNFSSDHFSQMGEIRVWGWISSSQWHRKQSDWQYFYVNGRYIKDKLVNHALRQAYQELLPEDAFAAYILYLEIDPQQVDVNVHPTKHEVRFRQTRLVHDFIYSALNDALVNSQGHIKTKIDEPVIAKNHDGNYVNPYTAKTNISQSRVADHLDAYQQLYSESHQPSKPTFNPGLKQKTNLNVVAKKAPVVNKLSALLAANSNAFFGSSLGCLLNHYVLTQNMNEQEAQIYIIHIRRSQQFLLKQVLQWDEKRGEKKPLLIPETLILSSKEIDLLMQYQTSLLGLDLDINRLADNTLVVRSLPSLAQIPGAKWAIGSIIQALLVHFQQDDELNESQFLEILVMALQDNNLSLSQQDQLLDKLSQQIQHFGIEQAKKLKPPLWRVLDESALDDFLA